jgi:glycosyltransferase involved in cell wall biosynthesis
MSTALRGPLQQLRRSPSRRCILFAAGALHGGGAEGQLLQLANGLCRLGHDVIVATLSAPHAEGRFRQVSICGPLNSNRAMNALMLCGAGWRLGTCIRQVRPDAMVTWLALPTLMGAAAVTGTGVPWVAAIRNSAPERLRSLPSAVLDVATRTALSRATLVVANSAAGLDGYRRLRLLGHTRTLVIPNSVDGARFRPPCATQRAAAREALGIGQHAPLVAYVGRDAAEKRIDLLVSSLASLTRRLPEAQVLVVGVADSRLRSLAKSIGVTLPTSLIVRARMQEIETVYWAADVLLLTSRVEGSPNVVHEARACGTAVVSTDCGDVRETMLPHDRVVGAEPDLLAEAIAEVIGAGSQRRVTPNAMSPEACAARWADAIESMISRGRGQINQCPSDLPMP